MGKIEEIYGENQSKFFFKNLYIARKKLFNLMLKYISTDDQIIDIGTTPVREKHENFFLHHYQYPENITCFSNQNLENLKTIFPTLKTLTGDGRDTKLSNNSYDIAISNATLEHVGSFEKQCDFVKELHRISKKRCIVSTPNRFYPLDTHTMLPLIHWLPKKLHRKILTFLKYNFLAKEENLNLLSKNDLIKICKINNFVNFKILKLKFYFLTSNLILIIEKN